MTLSAVARTVVINHGQWQSDKWCSGADWEEKLLWRECDGEEALTTSVNKGHHSTEADPNSSQHLNLPWKAITATQLASSWPSPPLFLSSCSQRNRHSAGPQRPLSTNSEMSSPIWRQTMLLTEETVYQTLMAPLLVVQVLPQKFTLLCVCSQLGLQSACKNTSSSLKIFFLCFEHWGRIRHLSPDVLGAFHFLDHWRWCVLFVQWY